MTTDRNMSEQRLQQKYAARIATIDIIAVMADMLIFIGPHP